MKFFYIFLIASILVGCNSQNNSWELSNVLNVDLTQQSTTGKRMGITDYYKNVDVMQVHLDDGVLGEINDVLVSDSCIVIVDNRVARLVFVYSLDGKLKYSLKATGKGRGEFISIRDVAADAGKLFIHDSKAGKMLTFNICSGKFQNEKRMTKSFNSFDVKDGVFYLIMNKNRINKYMLEVCDSDFKTLCSHLNYSKYDFSSKIPVNCTLAKSNEGMFFMHSLIDSIFLLDHEKMQVYMSFDCGSKSASNFVRQEGSVELNEYKILGNLQNNYIGYKFRFFKSNKMTLCGYYNQSEKPKYYISGDCQNVTMQDYFLNDLIGRGQNLFSEINGNLLITTSPAESGNKLQVNLAKKRDVFIKFLTDISYEANANPLIYIFQ